MEKIESIYDLILKTKLEYFMSDVLRDINVIDFENVTLRIKNPKSNFSVELNGENYLLSEDGTKLEKL